MGCDNGWACQLVSLVPEDEADTVLFARAVVSVSPGPEPDVAIDLTLEPLPDGALTLVVDGKALAEVARRQGTLSVAGTAARAVLAAAVNGRMLELWRSGKPVAAVSLRGSAAALRYVDEQQRRAGTAGAFVARGAAPASAIPTAPALPDVPRAALAERAIEDPSGAIANGLRRFAGCDDIDSGADNALHAVALDGRALLVLVPCGSGAYNASFVPLITAGGTTALATFDLKPDDDGQGRPLLMNADWDAKTGTLSSYYKGRGLGDCGAARNYVWDGTRFRLVEARGMNECRGAADWITIWRATPKPR
ncbi:MAG: DUF1176 domain-containing protein [Sphingomonas sp.]|nr:DUF1176 domain-containing protein [Sphingomonas sp.]